MPDPRIWPIERATDSYTLVGLASTLVLAANPTRADADFINVGANWIYLGKGHDAVFGSGEPLSPRGGSYHIGTNNLFHGEIYAISDNETNLSWSEGNQP